MTMAHKTKLNATQYDRDACRVGVVHLGYGAFHRAHQAVYIDDYMDKFGDLDWGIAAVNLRPEQAAHFDVARELPDGYVLKTTAPDGHSRYRLVRSHVAFCDWSRTPEQAEALVARASVKVISITVTESGYYLNDDWALNTSDPVIRAEISGQARVSVYGYLARALATRSRDLDEPITVLCCDNIRSNGRVLERSFLSYLEQCGDHDLASWVRDNVRFPCSMVDRITPRSSPALLAEVDGAFPGRALDPVHGEDFIQWVVENDFAAAMPALDRVGALFVADVDPYEEAKIRVLNGGHTGLCYVAALAGHATFDQAMRDTRLRPMFELWERENVLPGLDIDLPFDKLAYLDQIAERFENRAIADQLGRICMDGWSKMPIFVSPTLAACLRQGISPEHGYRCVASWYVYARRFSSGDTHIPYVEPYWEKLRPLLAVGQERAFAQNVSLWGDLPEIYDEFVPGVIAAIGEMEQQWPV